MHFTIATVLAVLPLLAMAAPQTIKPRTGVKIPISKRSNLVKPDGAVNIEALRNHLAQTVGKIDRGFAAYERNTGKPHPSAKKSSASKRGSGGDALTDDSSRLWYGNIEVGTPAVSYKVDFDTGSSDLFLPGPECSQNCGGHTVYNPSSSSSSKDVGRPFSLRYGDRSTVQGEQYTDTVAIAGLTATSQTLGAATQYSTGFSSSRFPADGLMGMAYQSIAVYQASPVFQTLVSDGQTDSPVFAFKLASSGAELYVGGTDSSLYSGSFTYAPVTHQGYWQVDLDAVNVGGQAAVSSVSSIIDTGTTLIIGDFSNVAEFYRQIPGARDAASTLGAGYWTVPCSSIPSISLTFAGQSFDISADTFTLGPISSGSSRCLGGVVGSGIGNSFWIVGDAFLQNVYTVFDYGNNQVGFASLA